MLRALALVGLVFVVAAGSAWLADQPGTISYDVMDRSGTLNTAHAVILLLAILAVGVAFLEALIALWRMPRRMAERAEERRRVRAFDAISDGLLAVAAGDLKTAERAAADAARAAPDAPLTALLAAQAAQMAGRRDAAQAHFGRMTGDRRTYTLGLRGLHVEALRAGDFEAARQHARAAAAADPALPWASSAAFDAATADRDWAAALALLENAQRNGVVDRAIYRRRKAVLLTAMAAEEAQPSPESARRKAAEAHGLAKELVPAAVLAAKLTGSRSRRQANAILEETYRLSPHPDLFAAAFDLAGQSAAERLKRAETLSAIKPRHVDSALGLAAAARAARRFDEAREALRPFAEDRPTQRVCVAMAEIEAADTGDEGRVREWLARAVRAPRDPAWIADGVVAAEWAPVSPVTGRLDAFRWRVPDGVSDHHGPAIDLAALRPSPLAKPADAALPGPGDG